jgi:hypothetical protein
MCKKKALDLGGFVELRIDNIIALISLALSKD